MQTATQFIARYTPPVDAVHRCYYCAGKCDTRYSAGEYVKDSFTARDTVSLSQYVCPGCVKALDEKATITLLDGEIREGQKTRCYSWFATSTWVRAASKSHRTQIAALLMVPPQPPFVMCISDSGQRQLLYRAVLCHSENRVTVTLEGDRIDYEPRQLHKRLELMKQVCAATGKPALLDTITPQTGMRVIDYFGDSDVFAEWQHVQREPLTRLAAWICPPKEDCQNEHPERINEPRVTVPAAVGPAHTTASQRAFSWAD